MLLSSLSFCSEFKYKLYYHPEIGILFDTQSHQISTLCESLNGIINLIDVEPEFGHKSSILVGSNYQLDIFISPRQSRFSRPVFYVNSQNSKFLKAASKLISQYFYEWRHLPRPTLKQLKKLGDLIKLGEKK